MLKRFYLVSAVVGAVITWVFLGSFFIENGFSLPGFLSALFVNNASGAVSIDVLFASVVFWVWSYRDARQRGIRRWWLIPVTNLTVGLLLALPLYLYWREDAQA